MATSVQVQPTATATAPVNEEKKERKSKPKWELPEGQDPYTLELGTQDLPEFPGYDENVHRGLNSTHFADEPSYLTYKAILLEREAEETRQEAKDWKENAPKIEAERKLKSMFKQWEEMEETLRSLGQYTEEQIAAMMPDKEAFLAASK